MAVTAQPPAPTHLCSSRCAAHVPQLRAWVLGETEGRRGLSSTPPSTVAHRVRGQAYPSRSGPGLHQGVRHLSGRSHASDAYSSSDCRASPGSGGGESTPAHSLLTVSEARGHGVGFQPITSSQFYGQLSMTWVKRPARTEPCQHMCPPVRAHFLQMHKQIK